MGKYVQLEDAYLSVSEALRHAAALQDSQVQIDWVDSERLEEGSQAHDPEGARRMREVLEQADGILIPGGFGGRGIEGKIVAAQIARERRIPYLGICLGMQIAVAEFARHVAGMEGANSTEFDLETPYPVIDLLPEQKEVADLGGTMRLGADPIKLHKGSRAHEIYGEAVIYERHRHRYEVNNLLRKRLQSAGLRICGTSPDERLVEVIELDEHPFFVASQFHPEFKSRPERPAPLFRDFVAAALERVAAGSDVGAPSRRPSEIGPRTGTSRQRPTTLVLPATASALERRRLGELFVELCRIESPSGRERACAERVAPSCAGSALRCMRTTRAPWPARTAGTCLRASPARRTASDGGPDGLAGELPLPAAVRPPRHRPAAGSGGAAARWTAAGRTPTTASSAPTTRPRSR